MIEISSLNNQKIKDLKKQKNDLLFLDTPKLIEEAIKSGYEISNILIEKGKNFQFIGDREYITVNKSIIEQISNVKTSQGIIATVDIKQQLLKKPNSNFLVLDNVQDAGNVGTLIRSAAGANFNYVYLVDCASIKNIKTVRSSMGAIFKINCFESTLENFTKDFSKWNLSLYFTDMKGNNIFKENFKCPLGIVVGNEGNGVRNQMKELCNRSVSIPMHNNLDSLNVAVSGSIVMYQISKGE